MHFQLAPFPSPVNSPAVLYGPIIISFGKVNHEMLSSRGVIIKLVHSIDFSVLARTWVYDCSQNGSVERWLHPTSTYDQWSSSFMALKAEPSCVIPTFITVDVSYRRRLGSGLRFSPISQKFHNRMRPT